MASTSNADVLQTFKRVYGDLTNLLPDDQPLGKFIPFSEKQKVGEKYVEAVVLTNEVGWTLSDSTDAFACIVNMAGQVDTLYAVEAYFDDGTQVANAIAANGLTASTLAYEAATGANGNMAVRVVLTGLDAATSGILSIKMYFKSK